MNFQRFIFIPLFLVLLCLGSMPAMAQKEKDHPVSGQDRREAEFYFTEGEKFFILEEFPKALVLFEKSTEKDPENAAAHYKMAQIYREMGDLVTALEHSTIARHLAPENRYYHAEAAEIYTQLNEYDKAIEIYKLMISELPDTEEYYFELAAIYLFQQRFDDALDMYDNIEQSFGISEEIIVQKQSVLLELDRLDEALAEGQKLIENFPYEESYLLRQVELMTNNGRKEEAREWLTQQLEEDPRNGTLRLALSELQLGKGEVNEEAMENMQKAFRDPAVNVSTKVAMLSEFRESLATGQIKSSALPLAKILTKTHPSSFEAWSVTGDLYQAAGDQQNAKDAYVKALKFNSSSMTLWQNVLQLLSELKQPDSVQLLSEDALELYPNNGMLYYYNGLANLQKKNYDEAAFAFEQGKRLSSANLELVSVFNTLLGDTYYGLNDTEKGDRAYEAVLDYDPDNAVVLNNYSYFLAQRGEKLDKAEEMSARTVEEYPENVTYLDTYAWVLFRQKKFKQASRVMEKALEIGNVSSIHYEHYGDILFKLGDTAGAVKQWKKAAELHPGSKEIERKINEKSL